MADENWNDPGYEQMVDDHPYTPITVWSELVAHLTINHHVRFSAEVAYEDAYDTDYLIDLHRSRHHLPTGASTNNDPVIAAAMRVVLREFAIEAGVPEVHTASVVSEAWRLVSNRAINPESAKRLVDTIRELAESYIED